MNKLIMKLFSLILKFFSLEVDGFDILNSTEVLRRKNVIVNRLLLITNILITIFIATYYESIGLPKTLSLLIPTILINVLITYFVSSQKDDYEKQVMGMYLAVLSVSYIALRLFFLYPEPYTYIFIYIALVIIALFQNRHAIILGDVLIFSVATFIHISEVGSSSQSLITMQHDIMVYTMFLILFIFVITSMVFFSEYMDKERKNELKKREELENEFQNVLWDVFDTIDDFSQVRENDELSNEYVSALMTKRFGFLLKFDEQKCDELFNFAIVIGVNTDFDLHYSEDEKNDLLKDYSKIRYKLGIGNMLLRRTRIRIKSEAMVRSRYESWFVSDNFKKIKAEDSSVENQMVLLCEIYITLREKQSYKKALPHNKAIKELTETFNHFFDEALLNTFVENHVEFEVIYERTRG
ncbi:hypothetical protein KHQ81_04230 [Mycoplasmatota bacterium]|nr:hypothetical protein KHQ81_04230 [Mycoplasmatota bacterium]